MCVSFSYSHQVQIEGPHVADCRPTRHSPWIYWHQ
uniref:Uncharacterized protein n=1 Tax=Anguilla anguilla TaxID=7936 RepID=A0A0E9VAZ3_ANGAN